MKNLSHQVLMASVLSLVLITTGCGRLSKSSDAENVLVMDLGENNPPPVIENPSEENPVVIQLENPVSGSAVYSIGSLLTGLGRSPQFESAQVITGLQSAIVYQSLRGGLVDTLKIVALPRYSGPLSVQVNVRLFDGSIVSYLIEGRIALPSSPSPTPTVLVPGRM